MEKQAQVKKELFDQLLAAKKEEFTRLRNYQQEQLKSINNDDQDKHDMIESPMEAQMREIRAENEVLDQLEADIEKLEKVDSIPVRETVQPWSVVETDKQNFLVFMPQDELSSQDKKYVGISDKAPIYKEMEGKKAGDSFTFGEQEYSIKTIM